ncbi:hypothetical protein DFQ26_007584 [Actinomortierella ambigua]|nr:hypothetical protein DFQ26_007584 [Actinomortierella ambigua]
MPPIVNLLSLPVECQTLILDCIEEKRTQTLCSLLTVCKALFHISVRKLYYDPLRSLNDLPSDEVSVIEFLRLITRLSPFTDSTFERHRLWIGFSSDQHGPLSGAPYVDYLSFVKVFRLSTRNENLGSIKTVEDFQSLLLGVCGHQLPSLRAISIPCQFLDAWTCHIPDLVYLNTIEFVVGSDLNPLYFTHDIGKNMQDQIPRAVAFTKKLLEARKLAGMNRQLDIQLFAFRRVYDRRLSEGAWITPARELYALGCSVRLTKLDGYFSLSPHGLRILANPPEKLDLSRLTSIDLIELYGRHYWSQFATGHMANFLKRCQSLRDFKFCVRKGDEDIFKWAAEERRRAIAASADKYSYQRHSSESVIVPPVQHLSLIFGRHVEAGADVLSDALVAFGPTLSTIEVTVESSEHLIVFPTMSDLPKLSTFTALGHIQYGPSTFAKCPNLTALNLTNKAYGVEYDLGAPADPWILPKSLKTLKLTGIIAFLVPQASFASFADRLEYLEFVHSSRSTIHRVSGFCWDESQWAFPSLRTVKLEGVFARMFRISMLQQSPMIEVLQLRAFDVSEVLDVPLSDCFFALEKARKPGDDDDNDDASGGSEIAGSRGHCGAFFRLHTLTVSRYSVSDDVFENVLPSLFPRLTNLTMNVCQMQREWSGSQVWDVYRRLTRLSQDGHVRQYCDDESLPY